MTALSDIFAAIESVLTAAGAQVSPAVTQISPGEPGALTNSPVMAYWYTGERPWEANTMAVTQREVGFVIRAYWPGSIRAKASNRNLELEAATFARALYGELLGDVTLNGKATGRGLEVSDPTSGWSTVGSVIARTVSCELWVYMAALDSIGT